MRRPEGAGGGFRSIIDSSQRLTWAVGMRLFHFSMAPSTALSSLSRPRSWTAEIVTTGTPRISGSTSSSLLSISLSVFCLSSTTSHLLKASTTARPSCAARLHSVRSWLSIGMVASISTTTHSAKRMARSASATASFSILPVTLALRRMPAVSHSLIFWPFHSKSLEIASRVMPASGPVSMRSWPSKALTNVDLPALGWPMMANLNGPSPRSSPSGSGCCSAYGRMASWICSMPSPCSAEIASGSPKPSSKASIRPASAARLSDLLPTRITGFPLRLARSANCRSMGVIPTRASNTNRMTSASSTAVSAWALIRASSVSFRASSRPAVSNTRNFNSPIRASPSRRSRVTPGWLSTRAILRPTSRLNSVDLPTLGRPRMTAVRVIADR